MWRDVSIPLRGIDAESVTRVMFGVRVNLVSIPLRGIDAESAARALAMTFSVSVSIPLRGIDAESTGATKVIAGTKWSFHPLAGN